uniref:hypothetical protein n=1 Tax=Escherichia coli TaxID=562 RepID=UPI001CDA9673|nr:hypothetical protein [Escherichia coli]
MSTSVPDATVTLGILPEHLCTGSEIIVARTGLALASVPIRLWKNAGKAILNVKVTHQNFVIWPGAYMPLPMGKMIVQNAAVELAFLLCSIPETIMAWYGFNRTIFGKNYCTPLCPVMANHNVTTFPVTFLIVRRENCIVVTHSVSSSQSFRSYVATEPAQIGLQPSDVQHC